MQASLLTTVTIATLAASKWAAASPKYESTSKDQAIDYNQAYYSDNNNQSKTDDQIQFDGQSRPPRFGFPAYTQDVQATGNLLPSVYGPVRLDIGGLVLGTIVGLGAFFILPKLFHVVPNPYAGFKRSEDEENDVKGMSDLMEKIQESLDAFNVDSSACLQRAICSSLQAAGEKVDNHTANGLESVVDTLARNEIFLSLLEGTDWKKAVMIAEKGENCGANFQKCPNELVTVISAISRYLMSTI